MGVRANVLDLRYARELDVELPDIETRFQSAHARRLVPQVRRVAAMLVVVYLAYIPLTHFYPAFGEDMPPQVAPLQIGGLCFSLAFFAVTLTRWYARLSQPLTALAVFVIGSQSAAVCLSFSHPYDYLSMQTLILIIAAGYTFIRLHFLPASAAGWGVLLAFFVQSRFIGDLTDAEVLQVGVYLITTNVIGAITAHRIEQTRRHDFLQSERVEVQRRDAERLLLNILPAPVAARLKAGEDPIADSAPEVTIVFADLVDFTSLSASISAEETVQRLGELFSLFDAEARRLGIEKIKTIGDAYMVAAGLPEPRSDHAEVAAEFALAIREAVAALNRRRGYDLSLRIGMHSGPVVAGVIGQHRFAYDVWGDTVNTASRMESHGLAGEVQVSEATYDRLAGRYELEPRGTVEVKGKGAMTTYLLRGRMAGAGSAAC
jgi:class 3 adenylate cyclase